MLTEKLMIIVMLVDDSVNSDSVIMFNDYCMTTNVERM